MLVAINEHFNVEVAVYDKTDLHTADDLQNVLTEQTRLIGKQLINKCDNDNN